MEFTTHFELHSQATRLWGKSRHSAAAALRAYHPLRAVAPVKVDLDGRPRREVAPPNTTFRATQGAGGSVMGSARFIRHYSGHHGCFLFLRLLICLNLAGHLACSQVEQQTTNNMTAAEGRRGCLRPTRSAFREGPIAGCGQGRLRSVRDPRSRPSGARPLGRSPGGRSLHTTRGHAAGRAAARAQCREGRMANPEKRYRP